MVSAARGANHWVLSGLLVLGIGVATSGLSSMLVGVLWWFAFMVPVAAVLLAAAIARSTARHRVWSSVAGIAAGVASVTILSAPGTALLGFIPTFATFSEFHELEVAGTLSIASQDVPADAVAGILYLLAVGGAAIAFAADLVTHQLRMPLLAGVPLLVLVLVPSFVRTEFSNAGVFVLTAAVWLALVVQGSARTSRWRFAAGPAAAALVGALLLPLALPAVGLGSAPSQLGGVSSGLNPILTLGNDLRRADPTLALTYTTSVPDGQYLRLSALDDFSGTSWGPTTEDLDPTNDVELIGPIPGLGADVPVSTVTTTVTVGSSILSRWLPVPYAATSVAGLDGDWSWEPAGLTVRTESSNVRGQSYEVRSVQVAPSIEQLRAAGTVVEPGLERYLVVPDDLPAVVGATASAVVAEAVTNYDRAIALQSFFRDGSFVYSEVAPVEQGFDGSGSSVLASFLEAKSGYCVHFSSAMAAMARTLGIPARVVVGFTPGERTTDPDTDVVTFRVTTQNFHAWPELFFAGIGWVRFEPTPGRGFEPAFAPLALDDPSTPDVDESVPAPATTPSAVPSAAPTRAPSAALPVDSGAGAPDAAASAPVVLWPLIVVLAVALLFTPWAVRAVRRRSRLAAVRAGSARAAWDELAAVVTDLGLGSNGSLTPRQLADVLAPLLNDDSVAALARLRGSLEAEVFAGVAGAPRPADLRAVLRGVRRGSGMGARAVATLLPRSLLASWLPRTSAAAG